MTLPAPLRDGSAAAPATAYDVSLTDLDGVVYRGPRAIPTAAGAIAAARDAGMRVVFVTNNALRPPDQVAGHLTELQVPARPEDVVTSAQAAAALLAERLAPEAAVLVCGGEGLALAVREAGLRPVHHAGDRPAAVVSGFDPTMDYPRLAEAALAIRAGAWWVASNLDATVPAERGLLPGNGALVALLAEATGARPVAAGKPERALHEESIRRSGATRPLIVGDRLDTDIEAGNRWGTPSLLVLTGVATANDLLLAAPVHRPSLVAADLGGLLLPHPGVAATPGGWRCRGWLAEVRDGGLVLARPEGSRPAGAPSSAGAREPFTDDGLDGVRAAAVAAWAACDRGAAPKRLVGPVPPGSGLVAGPLPA